MILNSDQIFLEFTTKKKKKKENLNRKLQNVFFCRLCVCQLLQVFEFLKDSQTGKLSRLIWWKSNQFYCYIYKRTYHASTGCQKWCKTAVTLVLENLCNTLHQSDVKFKAIAAWILSFSRAYDRALFTVSCWCLCTIFIVRDRKKIKSFLLYEMRLVEKHS